MNEKFFTLAKDKQQRIINAAIEEFAKDHYKYVNTEKIALKAGISKGLLFHYFKNKQTLYNYIVDYAINILNDEMENFNYQSNDFFELMKELCYETLNLLEKYPYLLALISQIYLEKDDNVKEVVKAHLSNQEKDYFGDYLKLVDLSKFKEDIDVMELFYFWFYAADGYLRTWQNIEQVDYNLFIEKVIKWLDILKQNSYRKEYLDESN